MALPAEVTSLSPDEYLNWEISQTEKHGYVAGEVLAMGGASKRHVTIALNLAISLDEVMTGKPCRVCTANMKVDIAAKRSYFYPNVFVTRHPDDHRAELAMHHPVLVAEILSPSTAAYVRDDKFIADRKQPTLKEYLLIDPTISKSSFFAKERMVSGYCRILSPAKRYNRRGLMRRLRGKACFTMSTELFRQISGKGIN